MTYLQSCFLLDYGNRTPIKNLLLKYSRIYHLYSSKVGLLFYVNNNPYNLELYFVLEVESDYNNIFIEIKNDIMELAIKELSSVSNINLLSDLSDRRFNVQNLYMDESDINIFFNSSFMHPERSTLIKQNYKMNFNTFYPNTIFFSYSNNNLDSLFEETISLLNADSFPVFYDRKSLFLSNEINHVIKKRIKECKFIVFFLDQEFLDSSYCKKELHWAKKFKTKSLFIVDKNVKFEHPNLYINEKFDDLDARLVYKSIKEFIFGK